MIFIFTTNVERFAGLNIHGFHPMKFFTEILLQCLGQQCLLLYVIIAKYSREYFCGTLKNYENRESYPSESFPVYGILHKIKAHIVETVENFKKF